MKWYGNILVHIAVAIVWIGPKPGDEFECDHLNGITTDNRASNLQWVTPAENRKRAKLLRVLRSIGRDPKQMSREELQAIFAKYEFGDPATEVPDTGHRKRNTILSPEGHDYFRAN